ncbi:MAG: hypothetical protein V3V99_05500 [candidate division Zixibacteria bacterium]
MRLSKFTALAGMLIIATAFMISCSSNDNNVTTPTITYGDNDDPEFVPMQVQIDSVLYNFAADILDGLENLQIPPGDPTETRADLVPAGEIPLETDPDTLFHVYQNGWHYVYAKNTGNTYESRLRDSVRYEIDNVAVETATYDVDYIHVIDNWTFTAVNQNVTHTDYAGHNEFEISGLDLNECTITSSTNNNISVHFVQGDSSMTNTFSFSINTDNLVVAKTNEGWKSGCPSSGTVSMTLSHVYTWDNGLTIGNGSSSWTIEATFDDGTATVTADNGTETWRYTCEVCTIPSGQ